ncbi:MAG: dipeptide/oligopeptide/nickel ABC transporter permease/ATP-binding protein, partial [Actinomycetota bacterium]
IVGLTAGYLRGRVDAVTSLLVDVALAFPGLVLLIAVRATFGNSMFVFIVLFALTSIPPYARIVRGATFALAERDFVDAASSLGARRRRILLHELAPNIVLPVLSFAFIGFALVIVAEGGLAFIGLSLDELTWGLLIADGAGEIAEHPHLALIPATVMFLTILAFNLVGDGLRRRSAPREVVTRRRLVAGPPAPDRDRAPTVGDRADDAVLRIADLHTTLHTPDGDVRAVEGVSLGVRRGETLAVVGESGSGKTMILRSIVGAFPLADVTRSGDVEVAGVDMLRAPAATIRSTLGTRIGMVSQNPLTALNPVRRIEHQLVEPMLVHGRLDRTEAHARALDLLRRVGIPAPERRLRDYPHQLSGGMRQRVTIAIALANEPDLLLADEPTTALDVTVQAQILRLLADLQREQGMAMVLVTHDLAVVRGSADRVAIVYGGRVVETGATDTIFSAPRHRYTVALLRSVPDLSLPPHSELEVIDGLPPSLLHPPTGCRFAPRCDAATDRCRTEEPPTTTTSDGTHRFRCHHPVEQPIGTSSSSAVAHADPVDAGTASVAIGDEGSA